MNENCTSRMTSPSHTTRQVTSVYKLHAGADPGGGGLDPPMIRDENTHVAYVYIGPIINLYLGNVFCRTNKLLSSKQSFNESIERWKVLYYCVTINTRIQNQSEFFLVA